MLRYVWIALVVIGCKYPDPGGSGDDGPSETMDLIVQQTPTSTKLYLVSSLEFGLLDDLTPDKTFAGHARVFTVNDFVFVATTDAKLLKLRYDEFSSSLVDQDMTLDFTPLTIDPFEDSWVVMDTKAYYFDSLGDRAFFVDLDTMRLIDTTSIGIFDIPNRDVVWTGAAQRDDDVYISLYYVDPANPLVHETEMTVLRIDETRNTTPIIHDSRCIHAQMIGVAPNGTVLIVGDASYYREFGMPAPAPENCLARITSSEPNMIDLDGFFRPIDNFMDGDVSGSYSGARTADTAYLWARDPGVFSSLASYQSMSKWKPHTLSIESVDTHELITDDIVNIGKPGRTFLIGDKPYFAVNKRDDNMPGGAIRTDIGVGNFEEVGLYSDEVVLVARIH